MARPKRDYEVRRVRLEGLIPVNVNPQDDALLEWLDRLPRYKKFPIVWAMLKAGGTAIEQWFVEADLGEAEARAEDIFNAFLR